METNQSIEQVLENMDNTIVYKTKSSYVLPVLLFIAGVGFFMANSFFEWPTNSIYPSLFLILGSVSFLLGIIKFFFRKTYFISAANHQKLRPREIYFDVSENDKLLKLMTSGKYAEIDSLKRSVSAGLKLRILSTKDGQICFSQIISFVQFDYVRINAPIQHSAEEAQMLNSIR